MKRVHFFATPGDIKPVLEALEAAQPIQYVSTDSSSSPRPATHRSWRDLPDLGVATHETGAASAAYLVAAQGVKLRVERIDLVGGGKVWAVDNGGNPETASLTPAGLWGGEVLLPGSLTTLHDTEAAQRLMKGFLGALKSRSFTKVRQWWLGPEAMERLRSGKRLTTTGVGSPPDFDLTPD